MLQSFTSKRSPAGSQALNWMWYAPYPNHHCHLLQVSPPENREVSEDKELKASLGTCLQEPRAPAMRSSEVTSVTMPFFAKMQANLISDSSYRGRGTRREVERSQKTVTRQTKPASGTWQMLWLLLESRFPN